jgi:hypothetical protein
MEERKMTTIKLKENIKRLIAGISLLMFILPQWTWADPSPGIKWLQNEPASLFDLGILRLEKYLDNIRVFYIDPDKKAIVDDTPKIRLGSRGVVYFFQSNKLLINIIIAAYEGPASEEDKCKNSVEIIRKSILWEHGLKKSGIDIYGEESTRKAMKSFFNHEGYIRNNPPNSIGDELASITYLKVSQLASDATDGGSLFVSCEMLLAGGPISITR